MAEPLPKFNAPPVIETVMGLQFNPLAGFTEAHAGWFWKSKLADEWTSVQRAPRILDQFERFGDDIKWGPNHGIRISPDEGGRIQIINNDDDRMIQVQNSRFIYNWRKREGGYPSFDSISPEFTRLFSLFQDFNTDAFGGVPDVNQWEITYVNHIPKGELWTSPKDWVSVINDLSVSTADVEGQEFDGFNAEWRLLIHGTRGRLHITARHGRKSGPDGDELLILQLTARGPVVPQQDYDEGFRIGHEAIVRSFAKMTSKRAHEHWKRIR